jgi:Rod binding domain-containing protein
MNPAYMPFPTTRRAASARINIHPGRGPLSQHDKLIEQTRKWVAISLFEPMLQQMRNSPFRSDLLDGGSAGKAFESMYDERLAERMASDASDTLVQSIVRKIEGGKAYARQVQHAQQEIDSEREGADRTPALSTGVSHVAAYF